VLPYAAAACVVLGLLLALGLPDFMMDRGEILAFDSPASAQLALALSDGTRANLDVDSAVTVNMTEQARVINLVKGRAFFDVAHDAQRPFSVAVGSSKVIALGTRFQVQRQDRLVIVTLEEGAVEIVGEFEGRTLREHLSPGEQLRVSQDTDQWVKIDVETETVTSWSRGRHVFRNTRLGEALDEVNRYAATKVRLVDPALADLTVSGNFMIGDSSMILSAFAAALPVRVVDDGSELLLFPTYAQDEESDPDRVQ
jgi:transmembrane sensor